MGKWVHRMVGGVCVVCGPDGGSVVKGGRVLCRVSQLRYHGKASTLPPMRVYDQSGVERWLIKNRRFTNRGARLAARNFLSSGVYAGLLFQIGDLYLDAAAMRVLAEQRKSEVAQG